MRCAGVRVELVENWTKLGLGSAHKYDEESDARKLKMSVNEYDSD